ncbi:sugar ABC transporter ATP-binding protein [Gordonia rhizosphera]|uniref:Putative sugar ABC transporter ATP-binding protein n=1 Tax=Gordonia rhizosphera NBRC 16068 TaxID=1108045 RepID=K6W1Z4_9ACTN|nr:sugar ABC transporter ATP-binding protein [Gordonia rhizosphera]GAB93190.1 putative sugar ABC transporter ATP-binding protein [Gordonia rhizosphera NBRC 16068]
MTQALPIDDAVATAPLVTAHDITKRFGTTVALDGVHIEVTPGRTHALAGRNGAGKSTLVSVLTGLTAPDEGRVSFAGKPAPPLSDREAWRSRVACVYQRSTIIPDLSVAENLFLNRQQLDGSIIRWGRVRRAAQELLDTWSVPVDADTVARDLTVEHRQLVEIARSLSRGARFIILDEPTAKLDGAAIKRLFSRIRDLQEQGVTFLFISHHLDETYEICQDITVFRDARHVITAPVAELSKDDLVTAMTGEAVSLNAAARSPHPGIGGTPVLTVTDLQRPGEFSDLDLAIGPGEIVGLAGGGASGKVEVAETIVGLRKAAGGSVRVCDTVPRPGSVRAALHAGIAFVPHDRHDEGLIPEMSVADNVTLTVPEKLGRFGRISRSLRDHLARKAIDQLDIKSDGPLQDVDGLSGGNQQKVVLARALASAPTVLVLITPTAGVDVRSKATLLGVVRDIADTGTGVLVVSDEVDDLRDCDRVLVMVHGHVVHNFPPGWGDNELVAAMEGLR